MKRRIFLKGAVTAVGLGFLKTNTAYPAGRLFHQQTKKNRSVRFAHITDVHVKPDYCPCHLRSNVCRNRK